MQKDPYKKENNLEERETISEIEMNKISEKNKIPEVDKGEKNEEKKGFMSEKTQDKAYFLIR